MWGGDLKDKHDGSFFFFLHSSITPKIGHESIKLHRWKIMFIYMVQKSHKLPRFVRPKSFATVHRPLSSPVELSNALTRDA
jgi:hypothetical protein